MRTGSRTRSSDPSRAIPRECAHGSASRSRTTPRPEILLLDEVHEALDHEYREVVEARAHEIVAGGGIVVAAGHDHPLLERICTRALWFDGGRIVADGPFAELQERYLAHAHADGTEPAPR